MNPRHLSDLWTWQTVEQQFWNSGGTEAMAREFFARGYRPGWRRRVPAFIAQKRSQPQPNPK